MMLTLTYSIVQSGMRLQSLRNVRLQKKQQAFIQAFVYQDLTNTECAFRAGYSVPTQSASMLLNDPRYTHVQNKIRELQESNQKKYEITFEKVARDLQMIRDAAVEDGSYGAAVNSRVRQSKVSRADG